MAERLRFGLPTRGRPMRQVQPPDFVERRAAELAPEPSHAPPRRERIAAMLAARRARDTERSSEPTVDATAEAALAQVARLLARREAQ